MAWDELTERQVELARRAGALSLLPVALDDRVHADLFCGRLAAAMALAAEADAVVEATGSHLTLRGAIALANWRGQDAEAQALIEARRQEVLRRGEGLWLVATDWGNAVRYNGLGRYDEALAAAERAAEDPRGLGTPMWLLADLIEAAVRSGKPERAAGPLERLTEIAEANGTDWALGVPRPLAGAARRGRGRRAALPRGDRAARPHPHPRRAGPDACWSTASGCAARTAASTPASSSAPRTRCSPRSAWRSFAERARRELLATGETVRKRTVETLDDLTPQELQIAQRAADGQHEPGDRRPAVPQPAHRRVAPAQGVRQARHQLAQGAPLRAARRRRGRRDRARKAPPPGGAFLITCAAGGRSQVPRAPRGPRRHRETTTP